MSRHGFTLLEILIVGVLLSVILGGVVLSLLSGQRTYSSAEAYLQVQEQARHALDIMTRELHNARNTIVSTGTAITFQRNIGFDLALPLCTAGQACWGALDQLGVRHDGWKIRYRLTGTTLFRDILNELDQLQGASQILARNVAQTNFVYSAGNKTITIQLDVKQTSSLLPGGSMAANFSPLVTTIRLRN